jgi:hypothetical protein
MVTFQVEMWSLSLAIRRFIKGTQKDVALETQRQAKLLCLELAAKASPRPRGVKGLAAAIPKIWARRVRGQIGTIVKGVGSIGLFQLARLNSASIFKNSYYPGKVTPQMRTVTKMYRTARGETVGKQVTEISPLHRIMEATKKDPQRALLNLRQLLKARLSGSAPTVYDNFMGRAVEDYYGSLKNKAQGKMMGKNPKIQRVYINTSDPRPDRETLAKTIDAQIGTVKAGWVQAGLAIPVKAGPRVPAWLTGKRSVGMGQVNVTGMRTAVALLNTIGNAGGVDDRTQYVQAALASRTAKLRTGLEEALKAQARQWYVRNKQPIPAAIAAGRKANLDSIDD